MILLTAFALLFALFSVFFFFSSVLFLYFYFVVETEHVLILNVSPSYVTLAQIFFPVFL